MVEGKITWTAICDDCGKNEESETTYFDWFGGIDENAADGSDFLETLQFQKQWNLERVSYEEIKVYCPRCVQKEKDIVEFEREQKRKKFQTAVEAEKA